MLRPMSTPRGPERREGLRARVQERLTPLLPLLPRPRGAGRVIYILARVALPCTGVAIVVVVPEILISRALRKPRNPRMIAEMAAFLRVAELTYAYPIMINSGRREPSVL